jgi:hypothetical protein
MYMSKAYTSSNPVASSLLLTPGIMSGYLLHINIRLGR